MGTLTLDGLRRGDCRELFNEEIDALRVACGLKREAKPKRNAEPKQEVKPKRNAENKVESKPKRNAEAKAERKSVEKPKRKKKV